MFGPSLAMELQGLRQDYSSIQIEKTIHLCRWKNQAGQISPQENTMPGNSCTMETSVMQEHNTQPRGYSNKKATDIFENMKHSGNSAAIKSLLIKEKNVSMEKLSHLRHEVQE